MRRNIFTIGHSTRPLEEFVGLLQANGIKTLVDVRTIPMSRRHPHFNSEALKKSLKEVGIRYRHIKKLGGLRHTTAASKNTGWRNASFRGYADYMGTSEFAEGLEELIELATKSKTAFMCAEAVPWRCHRSMISDALITKKWDVWDIIGKSAPAKHKVTPFLVVQDGALTYPPPADDQLSLPI
jgi:uncharacterized protein (DUF488 family)